VQRTSEIQSARTRLRCGRSCIELLCATTMSGMDDERAVVAERGLLTVPDEVWQLAVRRAEVIGPLAASLPAHSIPLFGEYLCADHEAEVALRSR
jgi:hypothetical protein